MFAVIETKGATHIAIHVPKDGCHASLPALARMLESNAVFIQKSWREISVVKPEMSIILGDEFKVDGETESLAITAAEAVIGDEFVPSTPGVMTSNREQITKRDAEIKRLQTELAGTKAMLEQTNARIASLIEAQQGDAS